KRAQAVTVTLSTPPDLISRAPLPSTRSRPHRPPDPRTVRRGQTPAPCAAPCRALPRRAAVAGPRPRDRSRFRPCQTLKDLTAAWAPCPSEFYREPDCPRRRRTNGAGIRQPACISRSAATVDVSTTHAAVTTARILPWPKRVSPNAPRSAV